ncbi:hypothetical protein [Palleronia caenipelagi]|uniref:Transposase n=1 Tax=Palleronia caenipelagi TaxID=2489174 RepID=A0A547PIS5_9RHOB|nr:hypothetical protein [Palleronia caenipelagi]TRD14030.1 hypothetical protein FEV53_19610 [Palleronia caenipelagi]
MIADHGRIAWQKATGYGQRSRSETQIGRYKQVIGPALRGRNMESQTTEPLIAVEALNRMTDLGRAACERVICSGRESGKCALSLIYATSSRHRPHGARHPCCHPPSSGASVMPVTAILIQTNRKRQDRSVLHADEPRRRALDGDGGRLTSPIFGRVRDHTNHPGHKTLDGLTPSGDYAFRRTATWGMSVNQEF